VKPDVFGLVTSAVRRAEDGTISTKEVVAVFEAVAAKLSTAKRWGRGLLVVLDEAGKALEHAAESAASGDIQLLQELAEAATRSGSAPIVFVVLLHQSFERYAGRLGAAQQNEWAKVQGRFEDVAFQEASEQILRLVGAAMERKALPKDVTARVAAVCHTVAKHVRLPGMSDQ
jgi:hypothetical protein